MMRLRPQLLSRLNSSFVRLPRMECRAHVQKSEHIYTLAMINSIFKATGIKVRVVALQHKTPYYDIFQNFKV